MRALLLVGVAALSLGACRLDGAPDAADEASLTAGAPFDIGLAPSFEQLPPADPVPVYYAPEPVAYDYWNDAYDMNQAYYDQPPAYFNYAGATPFVWSQPRPQSLGDTLTDIVVTRVVEALVGGGQREYFYRPENDYPFFIRDPNYAYALEDGRLVSAYDPYGQMLGEQLLFQQAPVVGRYLVRAENLRDAARLAALRRVEADEWDEQRAWFVDRIDDHEGWRATWIPGANRSPVAIQRLAQVRARKAARDEAHAAWKAELKAAPRDQGRRFAARGDDDNPGRGPKDNDKAKGAGKDKGNDKASAKKAEAPGKGKAKAQKKAEGPSDKGQGKGKGKGKEG